MTGSRRPAGGDRQPGNSPLAGEKTGTDLGRMPAAGNGRKASGGKIFDGLHQAARQQLITAPKYGNDDGVDELLARGPTRPISTSWYQYRAMAAARLAAIIITAFLYFR